MRSVFLFVFAAASALAQDSAPPAFDVASIKASSQFSPENRVTWLSKIDTSPGSLTMRNVNLTMIVAWAYDVQRPQVAGPAGMDSERYDIFAKTDRPAAEGEMRRMLQTLLAERFKTALHREHRQMEAMAMMVPKGGHKMKQSQIEGLTQNRQDPVRGSIIEGAALADLANDMSRELEMPVVDMTGLKGRFDFTFNVKKYVEAVRSRLLAEARPVSDSDARLMIMQDVMAGELGLRLESRTVSVDVVVIDHVEKSPTEN
jgi:uncharacterized protein (TIGR03435 family)